jgi:hypothetical protein
MFWVYKYLKILSGIAPLGVAGAAIALGPGTLAGPTHSAGDRAAKEHMAELPSDRSDQARVSERLAAICEAVSVIAQSSEGQVTPSTRDSHEFWHNYSPPSAGTTPPPNRQNWGNWNNWNNTPGHQ